MKQWKYLPGLVLLAAGLANAHLSDGTAGDYVAYRTDSGAVRR